MPATFRVPTYRSFGHFSSQRRPVASWMPSATATPAAIVSIGTTAPSGRSTTDTYSPAAAGDAHARPNRPRPAVCALAATTSPSAAPRSARTAAASLVDDTLGYQMTSFANEPRRGAARASDSANSAGRTSGSDRFIGDQVLPWTGLRGLDFETHVRRGCRMRQGANRHEVGAGRGKLGHTQESDAARN